MGTCAEADVECYSTHVGWERDWGPKMLEMALECLELEK